MEKPLLIDDAHLLDRPSAEALLFAARRLLADPIMVSARATRIALQTWSEGESHPLAEADLPRLQLNDGDLEAAQRIVRDRSERVVPIDLVARLHRTVARQPACSAGTYPRPRAAATRPSWGPCAGAGLAGRDLRGAGQTPGPGGEDGATGRFPRGRRAGSRRQSL
jgi:hypothetical protein